MPVVDPRLAGKPVPRISRETMERGHVARASSVKGSDLAFLDQRIPAYEREIIIADTIQLYPPELYENGMEIVTVATTRNLHGALNPAIKSLNYLSHILAKIEGVEHPGETQLLAESSELVLSAGGEPQLRWGDLAAGAEHRPERPRDQISPVVEMKVRDHDRIDPGPGLLLSEAGEHSGPAVQEDPARALHEVSGLSAAGIRPGRRAPDDRQLHAFSVA